jgi:RNA polymerase sigma-70 factor (ECF subfamily)
MGLDKHDAEDISQETFIKAYGSLKKYNHKYQFSTWLFTIARRLAISHFRKNKSRRESNSSAERLTEEFYYYEDFENDSSKFNIWSEAREILLPKDYQALWLHYGEGLPVKDVSRVIGISTIHARVILCRARKKLGKELKINFE